MAVDDLHGLWSVRGRWFYCSGFGADEGRPARGNAAAGDRRNMFGLWVLMGLALSRLDAASGLADARVCFIA